MDESGIHTNLIPRSTYVSPKEKNAYIKSSSDTTKDTIVVTISGNGNGFLFYVPQRDSIKELNGCSCVGNTEFNAWVKEFVQYASPGDVLLLDNLASHDNPAAMSYLKTNSINVLPFPVRCADELSVLDNSFFSEYKDAPAKIFDALIFLKGEELRVKKRELIYEVFYSILRKGSQINYFLLCGYYELFGIMAQEVNKNIT